MLRRKFGLLTGGGLVCSILLAASGASASPLTVASYTATTGSTGSFTYFDTTGTELTDGAFGVIPFTNQATADPWVGWTVPSPVMVFSFLSPVNVTEVDLDFGLWTNPALISLPTQVNINGTAFPLVGNEIANPSRGTIVFPVSLSNVTTVTVTLTNGGTYIFVDEASFNGSPLTQTAAPEPITLPLATAGLAALVWRRKKTA